MAQSSQAAEGEQSFPALLQRNATAFGDKPAYREKEFGIWQSWSWSETEKEIEALALGLLNLGVNDGDFIAIIGGGDPGAGLSGQRFNRDGLCSGSLRRAVCDC